MSNTGLKSAVFSNGTEQRDANHRKRMFGFIVFFLGLSQVIVGFNYSPTNYPEFLVLVGGGWLLIGFGWSLLQNKEFLPYGIENHAVGWITNIALLSITMAIFVLSVSIHL